MPLGLPNLGSFVIVRKTADETVNNSTTLQDDDHLSFGVGASDIWKFELYLIYNSPANADFKFAFSAPAGATIYLGFAYMTDADAAFIGGGPGTAETLKGYAAAKLQGCFSGLLIVGATAGTFKLQWAQNTAQVADTKLLQNSCIIAQKLN